MAGRINKELKENLVATGQWEAFLQRRAELKAEGFNATDARVAALSEVTTGRIGGSPGVGVDNMSRSVPPKNEKEKAAELPPAPPGLAGKSASEREIVRWVSRNIDDPNPKVSDCPDPFAWTLLRQCRESPAFTVFFVEKLWAKLIPSRAQLDADSGGGVIDGKPTLELIERIQEMRSNAESKGGDS